MQSPLGGSTYSLLKGLENQWFSLSPGFTLDMGRDDDWLSGELRKKLCEYTFIG